MQLPGALITRRVSLALILLGIRPLSADIVNIGVLSFNNLNPGSHGSPGINDFEIDNFTRGIFALPPDFPVVGSITLDGVQVSLYVRLGRRHARLNR